jgi:hypothetical protein
MYTKKMHDAVRRETKGKHNIVTDLLDEIDRLQNLVDAEDFWTNIVYPDGATAEQIQTELADYHMIMDDVAKVYDHITGGRISKVNTYAYAVIGEADAHYEELCREAMEDEKEVAESQDE